MSLKTDNYKPYEGGKIDDITFILTYIKSKKPKLAKNKDHKTKQIKKLK